MKSYFSTNRVLAWTITSVAVATFFFACKKEVTTDTAPNNEGDNNTIAAVQNEAQVSAMYDDLFETIATVAVSQGTDKAGRLAAPGSKDMADQPSCPSAELLDATGDKWPKRVIIDFGESCFDNFGNYRSGVINLTFSGYLFGAGATVVAELSNYKVNGHPVEGSYTISAATFSATTGVQYTTEVTAGKVTLSDSLVVNYASKKTVKQTDGGATPANKSDDVFNAEGTATLSYLKGGLADEVADFATETPLVKKWNCGHISGGKLKVDFNKISGVIDYGDGICDAAAIITVGDKAKEITL